jgi:gas vesicle protein
MKRMLSFFSGVLTGALVGAMVALLLTPESGENLRSRIQEQTLSLRDEIKKAAAERRAELEEQLKNLRAPME